MPQLNLSGQETECIGLRPKVVKLKQLLDARKEVWDRIPTAKKKLWITSGKDPVMTLAWDVYRYLRDNFFEEADSE